AVGRAVHIIASAERTTLVGKLEQVTNKSKIKAVFVIDPREEGRHELSDTVGKDCLLVIASAGDYLEGMDQVVADPDQNPLDLNGGDGDMSENGAWETDVEAAEAEFTDVPALPGVETFGGHTFGDVCRFVVTRLTQLDAAKLQSRFAISQEQAQRLIIMLLDEGVIAIEVEAEDPADNQYKVVAERTDLDINMECRVMLLVQTVPDVIGRQRQMIGSAVDACLRSSGRIQRVGATPAADPVEFNGAKCIDKSGRRSAAELDARIRANLRG